VDENIKIEHQLVRKYQERTGVFNHATKWIYEYMITLKNNKPTQENIEIWDQLPIPSSDQIKVILVKPEEKQNNLDKTELNYLKWVFNPNAGEEIKIPLSFAIEHPENMHVSGLE
jgi:hypothetical protein